jgi:hypothetical protein
MKFLPDAFLPSLKAATFIELAVLLTSRRIALVSSCESKDYLRKEKTCGLSRWPPAMTRALP